MTIAQGAAGRCVASRLAQLARDDRLLRSLLRRRLPLQSRAHFGAIVRMRPVEQRQLTQHNGIRNSRHRGHDVREQPLLFALVEQIEQGARLAEVVIADAVAVVLGIA